MKFDGTVSRESEKAILIKALTVSSFGDKLGSVETWFPKSQIKALETVEGLTRFEIPNWLAAKKRDEVPVQIMFF